MPTNLSELDKFNFLVNKIFSTTKGTKMLWNVFYISQYTFT